jgi:ABC-type transport system involved in cytochrome bd biosynthesis fused ATPase/permease subunit
VIGLLTLASVGLLLVAAHNFGLVLAEALAHAPTSRVLGAASIFALAFGGRILLAQLASSASDAMARSYAHQLTDRLLAQASHARSSASEFAYLLTDGMDKVIAYIRDLTPVAFALALTTPILLVAVAVEGLVFGIELAVGLATLPVLLVVIGQATSRQTAGQLAALTRLNELILDLLRGLPTLKSFGKARMQRRVVADAAHELQHRTLRILRIAFLSGVTLDTLSAIVVALVAVSIGIRLNDGSLGLVTGAAILFVTPEVFLPLRAVSQQFHANQDVRAVLGRIDELSGATASVAVSQARRVRLTLTGVGLAPGDTPLVTVTDFQPALYTLVPPLTCQLGAGTRLVVTGPSGVGKTALLRALVGAAPAAPGSTVWCEGAQGSALPSTQVRYLPAQPGFVQGTIAENLLLGGREMPPSDALARARHLLSALGAEELCDRLDEPVLTGGANLSAGERQRLGIVRTLLCLRPILVLDEPTAHLSHEGEQLVLALLDAECGPRALIVASHRPQVIAWGSGTLALREEP